MLGAQGAMVTWDAGGNEFIEVIRTVQACERVGIKTVFLTSEDDPTGSAPTMLEPVPEADAIVSTSRGLLATTYSFIWICPGLGRILFPRPLCIICA